MLLADTPAEAKTVVHSVERAAGDIGIHVNAYKWTPTKRMEKKARQQLHKNSSNYIEQILLATSHKTATVRPRTTHHENHPN